MKLLIVEDNPVMRQTIRLMVADIADEVSECSDGRHALAQYVAEQPDWVLMDIYMPGTNGISATRQIKASYAAARIIIVTSFDEPGLREAAVEAGACGYVLKENLLELRHWLQRKSESETTNPIDLPVAEKGTIR